MQQIEKVRQAVRKIMRSVAKGLDKASGGRISPDFITIFGLLMHIPVALLIATGYFIWAAILLVIFGLFDTLDGELARLRSKASASGMLLDAATDRYKEVILYTGIAYYMVGSSWEHWLPAVVLACGASLCVSYVKAKGEAAVAVSGKVSQSEINKIFYDGLFTFDIRMLLLAIGLLFDVLVPVVVIIAVLASFNAVLRLHTISKALK